MKDGVTKQEHGSEMHGAGLKKKYRQHPLDAKNRPTKGKQ